MQPGEHIGKYRVESLLGEGGNGAVYAARDTVLGRRVAVKLLHPHLVHDAGLAGRFRAEAAAMARLNHPHVVTVHDFVGEANRWAIVMELVENGETLGSLLARAGRLGPARALELARQVALGLGHAHDRGIVHRDVKPANVLVVTEEGREVAKVTDFGIARVLDQERRTLQNMTLGTLWYIAPEQAQDSAVDQRADVYALGVTLYEALTASVPFAYDTPTQVLAAHITEPPRPPSWRIPGIPPAVDRLVLGCLAKRPEERPADGRTLAEGIAAVARGLAEGARPIPATRLLSEAEVSAPDLPRPAEPAPGLPVRSFAAPPTPEERRSRERSLALWIALGVGLLTLLTCAGGTVLSCLTCAR